MTRFPSEIGFDDPGQRMAYYCRRLAEANLPPDEARERRRGWSRLDTRPIPAATNGTPLSPAASAYPDGHPISSL